MRSIVPADAEEFAREVLLSKERTRPVVGISTRGKEGTFLLDPVAVAEALGERAEVVTVETGEPAWALSAHLPPRADVYGGAARLWWPGFSRDSDPRDHPLLLMWHPEDERRVLERLVAAVVHGDRRAGRWGPWSPGRGAGGGAPASAPPVRRAIPDAPEGGQVRTAVVDAVEEGQVLVRVGDRRGAVKYADVPIERLARDLRPGQSLPVRTVHEPGNPDPAYSVRGLLRDPWRRIAEEYAVGDVVRARVSRVAQGHVLVELLPEATAIVPLRELDWTWVPRPEDLYRGGEVVKVKILSLEPEVRRCMASIKQAFGSDARGPVAPAPGEEPFLAGGPEVEAALGAGSSGAGGGGAPEAEVLELRQELESVLEDRDDLVRQRAALNEQVAALRKSLRGAEDRLRAVQEKVSAGLDPTSSETAFLAAVRVEYARKFDEGDRAEFPLQRMRVGREFLERLRALDGVEVEKVVEVCAQVASGRAHRVGGRSVHELRGGPAGSPGRTRASDGARAWRCALQDSTPSARRLHWWLVPGPGGATVEFASVSVHDDFSIPE